ncbi:hypothetical protein WH06_07080 [Aeromonas salmonicida subsp. salmonicida]|nr:hypothetical protein WH06_07080 [Aeromonas salmonicida subsp. salmonicida]
MWCSFMDEGISMGDPDEGISLAKEGQPGATSRLNIRFQVADCELNCIWKGEDWDGEVAREWASSWCGGHKNRPHGGRF